MFGMSYRRKTKVFVLFEGKWDFCDANEAESKSSISGGPLVAFSECDYEPLCIRGQFRIQPFEGDTVFYDSSVCSGYRACFKVIDRFGRVTGGIFDRDTVSTK